MVADRYWAASPSSTPGSWLIPDLRVVCLPVDFPGTVSAVAHVMRSGPGVATVLMLSDRPPLAGMVSRPVRLLSCWAGYLARERLRPPAVPERYAGIPTTIELLDGVNARLRHEAERRRATVSELSRQAIESTWWGSRDT